MNKSIGEEQVDPQEQGILIRSHEDCECPIAIDLVLTGAVVEEINGGMVTKVQLEALETIEIANSMISHALEKLKKQAGA